MPISEHDQAILDAFQEAADEDSDLSEYLVIDRMIQGVSSIHVAFLTDEVAFRFTYRCDGQPSWKSDLTPFKGSNTVSTFVALAERA